MTEPFVPRELALITGASSGIGYALAECFAQGGYDLLIVAEDSGIWTAAENIGAAGVATVHAVQADLTTDAGILSLFDRIAGLERPLAAAALNAGIGQGGKFAELDLSGELDVVRLNVVSTLCLAKHVVQAMKEERRGGKILFTSSVASNMPGTYSAVYNASKAFVQSLSLALHYELKEYDITVTALMPGPTETNFFHRADMDNTKVALSEKDDPAEVAQQGFDALMDGKDQVVAGSLKTKMMYGANDLIPEQVKAAMHAGMTKPGSAAGVNPPAPSADPDAPQPMDSERAADPHPNASVSVENQPEWKSRPAQYPAASEGLGGVDLPTRK